MFAKISEQLTESLEQNEAIRSEDRELYTYGFKQGLIILLNLATTLIIGLIFGKVLQLSLFMAAFIPLRTFAGGYHAKTPIRCYLLSIVMLTAVVLCMKHLILDELMYCLIITVSAAVILLLSPVEDINKPLDEEEIRVYKKRTLYILAFELVLFFIMNYLNLDGFTVVVCYEMAILGIMLIAGKLKNSLTN